jgi:predicted acyl esterase
MRKLAVLVALIGSLFAVSTAQAATPATVLDDSLTCGEVTDDGEGATGVSTSIGQVWCGSIRASDNIEVTLDTPLPSNRSTVKTFDGVPLDVNFALPDPGVAGPAPYPVVGVFHGYGGSKFNFRNFQRWLDKGYAVYSISQRGFGESCGSAGSRSADPTGCEKGWVHLMDARYEVRDTQEFLAQLADEDLIIPDKIAATGGSYGGGMSMSLATLKDRKMLEDGTLVPWTSPEGKEMEIAVAAPSVPWTELTYALAPNGNNLDYIEDASYFGRFGVMKESYVQGLSASGFKAPAGEDPRADINGWKQLLDQGEDYDTKPAVEAMKQEINTYHSSYGIDHSQPPAPLVIGSGYTDDLFPVNEATRFYNRTRAQFPNTPIALVFGSFGHARGQSQNNVSTAVRDIENQWVDYYLKGVGSQPPSNVTSYSQTCPNGTPGGGPWTAPDWASIAPGEIRVLGGEGEQTVRADGGDVSVGAAWNPLTANDDPCVAQPGAEEPGSANYETPPAPAGGYTMLGAPTVIAKIVQAGSNSQIAARLVDVSPDGNQKVLVARGLWRPQGNGFQVFQLFANNWTVEEGHKLRLELLPRDAAQTNPGGFLSNYARPSNGQQDAVVSRVDLRIPVVESPGALGGLVKAPAKRVLPDRPGVELAKGNEPIGSQTMAEYVAEVAPCPEGTTGPGGDDCTPIPEPKVVGNPSLAGAPKVKGKKIIVKLTCRIGYDSCRNAKLVLKGAPKKGRKGKGLLIVRKGGLKVARPGVTKTFRIALSGKARKFFRDKKVRKRGKKRVVRGPKSLRAKVTINGKSAGFTTVKRTGKVR